MRSVLIIAVCTFIAMSCNRRSSEDITKEHKPDIVDTTSSKDAVDTIAPVLPPPMAIPPDTVISYQRSGCFGTCPVYSFILFEDGSAEYQGTAHTKWIGRYQKTLDSTQTQGLLDLIVVTDLHRFRGNHPLAENEWILDLPTTTLISKSDSLDRVVIRNNHSAPKLYRDFEKTLRLWIESIDWTESSIEE